MNELLKTIHRRLLKLKGCCSAIRKDRTPDLPPRPILRARTPPTSPHYPHY